MSATGNDTPNTTDTSNDTSNNTSLKAKLKTLTDMLFNYITMYAFDEGQVATNPNWDIEVIGHSPLTHDLFFRAIAPIESDKGLSIVCSEVLTLSVDEYAEVFNVMKRVTANPQVAINRAISGQPTLPSSWAITFSRQVENYLLEDDNFFIYPEDDLEVLTTDVLTLRGVIHG